LPLPHGTGAIAVIRLSGPQSINYVEDVFFIQRNLKKNLWLHRRSHSAVFGIIMHHEIVLDEVLVTLFRAPHSFTGQDSAEISCHGSRYIQQQILQLDVVTGSENGHAGEFTHYGHF
jgi:tRNA modification GTPase